MEDNVHALAAILAPSIGIKRFFGKQDGTIPMVNELIQT